MSNDSYVTRREALHACAVVSGAVLGGTAVSGVGRTRRQGGSGFITEGDLAKAPPGDTAFVIDHPSEWILEHAAGCGGGDTVPVGEYQGYEIAYRGPTGLKVANLFLDPNRNVETGEVMDFDRTRRCPPDGTVRNVINGSTLTQPVVSVSFAPESPG